MCETGAGRILCYKKLRKSGIAVNPLRGNINFLVEIESGHKPQSTNNLLKTLAMRSVHCTDVFNKVFSYVERNISSRKQFIMSKNSKKMELMI